MAESSTFKGVSWSLDGEFEYSKSWKAIVTVVSNALPVPSFGGERVYVGRPSSLLTSVRELVRIPTHKAREVASFNPSSRREQRSREVGKSCRGTPVG